MRKNNKNDMTITEQIQSMIEEICNYYCKFSAQYDDGCSENLKKQLIDACEHCPFNRL